MSGSTTKALLMAALSAGLCAPLLAQTAPIIIPTTPVVDPSFRQHDWDVVTAERQFGEGELLKGDRYALRPTLDYVSGLSESFVSPDKLIDLRRKRLDNLIKRNKRTLDRDGEGYPVVRDRILLVDPGAPQLAAAVQMGFGVADDRTESALGLRLVSLSTPRGQSASDAAVALNRAVPGIGAELDPIYEPAGGAYGPLAHVVLAGAQAASAPLAGVPIVMIDGGVGKHAALKGASIEQQGFAGKSVPTAHGTAVASLLVGNHGPFRGSAQGAKLYVADIYGGDPAKGSASNMVRALAWAAAKKPAVITISLVGPRSTAVERAIAALQKSGTKIVAAVGNDGPSAPLAYPASYSGVVSVTGIDGKSAALMEAGRAEHIDFAAPAANLVAAVPGDGYMAVRGTSFAVPLVAGRLAMAGTVVRLAREASPGTGAVGLGVVCAKCGLAPEALSK